MKTIASSTGRIAVTAVLLLSFPDVKAQDAGMGLVPDIPPSPQASAFNRLGNYQVDNNYGAPDISIPLFVIDHVGYKIPLTLRYEATPLRQGYNYDVTGVGWTLSGNSCVSRTIHDIADECAEVPFTLDEFTLHSGSEREYLYYHYNDLMDRFNFQYDSYRIVLPTGRTIPFFMYKSDGVLQYHTLPRDSNVRISCSYEGIPYLGSINGFTVTDENGVTYNFTLPEKAANIFEDDPNAHRNVTWLLTSINIPPSGEIIYQYTPAPVVINTHNILREPVVTVCRLYDSWGEWPNERRFNVKGSFQTQSPRYEMRLLRRISYGSTAVDFNYQSDGRHMKDMVVSHVNDTARVFAFDVYGSPFFPNWHLNSLVISGQGGYDRLEYGFSYTADSPGDYTDYWGNRCEAGPSVNNVYGISINGNGLDDLGNFNLFFGYDGIGLGREEIQNQLSHDGILAQLIENGEDDHDYYYKLKLQTTTSGDTRRPTAPFYHGVLASITYPNGGRTTFNWENHRFLTATAADGDIVSDRRRQRIIEGGGFRIESVINWTADGTKASADYYRYGFTIGDIMRRNFPFPLPDSLSVNDTINHHIGCGEAVVDPNLFTFMSGFSYSKSLVPETSSTYSYADPAEFRKMLLGMDSRFKNISENQEVQGIPMWWEATFSASRFRSLVGGRQPVVYPEITVYHGQPFDTVECKSKTVYRYDIYKHQFPGYCMTGNYLSDFHFPAEPDTSYFEPLLFQNGYPALSCNEHPSGRHLLKSRSDYSYEAVSGTWELTSEEKCEYGEDSISLNDYIFESFFSRENYYPNYEGLSYNQLGFNHPLLGAPLRFFYKPSAKRLGRSTLIGKSTTTMRRGGARSRLNTLDESYEYVYPGVLRIRRYSDVLKSTYSDTYDKVELFTYSGDVTEGSDTVFSAMRSRNMLACMVSADTYKALVDEPSTVLSGSKVDYAFYGDRILPSRLYERNGDSYEETAQVLSYDGHNPAEIVDLRTGTVHTGIHSVFLWDPTGVHMTAMIRNATLQQVQAVCSQPLTGDSRTRHAILRSLLPDSQVQTWDYKPLTGVTSHTDFSGKTILYEYDGLGRLKAEKRIVNGAPQPETLVKYEYDYMNQ